MASNPARLDAFSGRNVVYCHICSNEWYLDQGGLRCPHCGSDFAETVTAENDPRPPPRVQDRYDPRPGAHQYVDYDDEHVYDDPDEEFIQEHTQRSAGGNFTMRQTTYPTGQAPQQPGRGPADGADHSAIVQRFTDMLMNEFQIGNPGQSGTQTLFPRGGNNSQPIVHRTVITRPRYSAASTSFTIATGPAEHLGGGEPLGPPGPDFNIIFGNVLGGGGLQRPQMTNNGDPVPNIFTNIHEIIQNLFDPANAVRGDGVYTDEAFNRIINNLMDQNVGQHGAPPAPQSAIDSLQKKKLDKEMMGDSDKAECTICIDDMTIGNEVALLPCKHWFHHQCVALWLKQHNTCPICRKPIENSNSADQTSGSNNAAAAAAQPGPSDRAGPSERRTSVPATPSPSMLGRPQGQQHQQTQQQGMRSNQQALTSGLSMLEQLRQRQGTDQARNQQRLDAIRSTAGQSRYTTGNPTLLAATPPPIPNASRPQYSGDRGSAGSSYSQGNQYGYNSYNRRDYDRSDSNRRQSSSRRSSNQALPNERGGSGSSSTASHNPFSWIRDRFTGGGSGSGSGSNHDGDSSSSATRR